MLTIVPFFVMLVVLILVHEIGHFITAKAFKVKVEEFGLGFPPRIAYIKRGETMYSLNALPLGGFVKMTGEEDPKEPGSLASKSIATRMLVLGAGSLMNAILPFFLFVTAFMVPHDVVTGEVVINEVLPDSPAASAGVVPGSAILEIDGKEIQSSIDVFRLIQANLGNEITFLLKRPDSTTHEATLIPRWRPPEGQGAVGIKIGMPQATVSSVSEPVWRAVPMGLGEYIETYNLFKNGIMSMIIGTEQVRLTGPVGIAQATGEVAKEGLAPLLEFAAFLSINLALINIFPLPALDGGRIAFVFLEWIRRGKRISPRTESLVHAIGFALLIMAIVVISFQDILNIISGESLIP